MLTRLAESKASAHVAPICATMSLEQQKQVMGCGDDSRRQNSGAGVPFLVSPSLGKLGSVLVINLKVTTSRTHQLDGFPQVATVEALGRA